MDNLLINFIDLGNQGGKTGNAQLKESAGVDIKQKDFLSILTKILSGSNNLESLQKKLKEIHESGEPGLAFVMNSISATLLSMIPPNEDSTAAEMTEQKNSATNEDKGGQETLTVTGRQKETKGLSGWLEQMNYSVHQGILSDTKSGKTDNASPDQITSGLTMKKEAEIEAEIEQVRVFQEEMIKLLSYLNSKSELSIEHGKASPTDKIGNIPVQKSVAVTLQQALLKEVEKAESEIIKTQNSPVTYELSTKEILEKNALLVRAILENGGKANKDVNAESNNHGDNKGTDGLFKPDEKLVRNTVQQSFTADQGFDEKGGDKPEGEANALLLNAAKKYKEHVSEADELKKTIDGETATVSLQKSTREVPQGDSFRANVFQVKDNNMTFEKGSFTSFVAERIEKIVEQFSNRTSQMDMVVRLKLDDKETLLVGLKHEGQKVIVDVKASNDGLVNLLQSHKDEIARHLEDKNIFTSIIVQPDGERNSERQNQRENKKEDRKQEVNASFINVLEAIA